MNTRPFGNRFGFPFTREEYVAAHEQVMPREAAESRAGSLYGQTDREVAGVHVADGDLLIIALLSEGLAERVLAFRPSLRGLVEHFRANRDAALAEWREAFENST